MSPYH